MRAHLAIVRMPECLRGGLKTAAHVLLAAVKSAHAISVHDVGVILGRLLEGRAFQHIGMRQARP